MATPQAFFKFASTSGIPGADAVKLRLTTNYNAIADVLGLTTAAATDPGQPISTSEALTRKFGSRLRITYKTGANLRRSTTIFCAADSEDSALKNLVGKNFGAYPIVSCGYPRRAKFI